MSRHALRVHGVQRLGRPNTDIEHPTATTTPGARDLKEIAIEQIGETDKRVVGRRQVQMQHRRHIRHALRDKPTHAETRKN